MKFTHFLGIDVSKKTFDAAFLVGSKKHYLGQFTNDRKGISSFIKELKTNGCTTKNSLICMEHTGIYAHLLLEVLYGKKWSIWLEQALQIKKSLGNQRGKNDRVDAERIAEYAYRFHDKASLWQPPRKEIVRLRQLVSLRARFMKVRKMLVVPVAELGEFLGKEVEKLNSKVIDRLNDQIKQVEQKIEELINDDAHLQRLQQIITSVDGVGKVTAWQMLIVTNEFKSFDSAKKFACYSGVVPFDHSSGSSIYARPKVSYQANKKMKELLHLAALSATVTTGELNDYYERKIAEGKSKMLVLNNIRNKLIHRIFTCVKQNRKYEKIYSPKLV